MLAIVARHARPWTAPTLFGVGAFVLPFVQHPMVPANGPSLGLAVAFGLIWLAGLLCGWRGLLIAVPAAVLSAWAQGHGWWAVLGCGAIAAVEGSVAWGLSRFRPMNGGLDRPQSALDLAVLATLTALARGGVTATVWWALGRPDALFEGYTAVGNALLSCVLSGVAILPWFGEWKLPWTTVRRLELAGLLLAVFVFSLVNCLAMRPNLLALPLPATAALAVLTCAIAVRFHAHGLSLQIIVWGLVLLVTNVLNGGAALLPPRPDPSSDWVMLTVVVAVYTLVILLLGTIARGWQTSADDNVRLNEELRARNEELVSLVGAHAGERAFLETVLSQMPAGVLICRPDGVIWRRNRLYREFWDEPEEETERAHDLSLYALSRNAKTELRAEDWPVVRALESGESTHGVEVRALTPAGVRELTVSACPVRGDGGQLVGAVSILSDVTLQRQAERRLRESEERLRYLLTATRIRAWEWDSATDQLTSSEPTNEWYGVPERAINTFGELLDVVHPDDRERFREAVDNSFDADEFECEFRSLTGRGETKWLLVRARWMTDEFGRRLRRMAGVTIDVTDRRRNESRLRLLESAVVHARDAVVVLSSEASPEHGRSVLYANEAFAVMTGYRPEEVIGRSLHVLRGPKSDPATLDQLRLALDAGRPFKGELLNYRKDGSEYWVELDVVPVCDDGGRCSHWVMIQRDVSGRRAAEEALRQSEQMLAEAQRIAHIGSWEVVPANPFARWSDEKFRIFGHEPQAFRPTRGHFLAAVHPDDRERVTAYTADDEAHRTPDSRRIEFRIVRPNGEVRYIVEQYHNEFDADGRPTRTRGVTHDVTDSRQAQQQLFQAQKMELIGQMAGGIAHDFNNLLTGLIGNLSLFELTASDADAPLVHTALTAANRAADLTGKLLGFARKTQLRVVRTAPADLVSEVQTFIARTFDPRITLDVQVRSAARIDVDPTLISQVLLNLALNARDAMPHGGRIVIRVEDLVGERVLATPASDHVRISVEDTGHGMTEEVRGRLFEPFFTTKPVGQGTGLGLAMVHGIMEQHDGRVECTSTVGVGTRFDLYFPVADLADSKPLSNVVGGGGLRRPATTDTPLPAALAGPRTVLLVDDETMIRDLGRMVLERDGFRVLEAVDGEDALVVFREQAASIDLVVLDLTMPRLSGLDTHRRMVEIDPTVGVILSSGYSTEDVTDADVLAYLPKPYRPQQLLDTVRAALRQTIADDVSVSS